MPTTAVSWDEFVQRVRRHRPTDLLPAIAKASISVAPDGIWRPERSRVLFPWALAVAARESIRAGNDHRSPGVSDRDLVEICVKYGNLYDPVIDERDTLAYLVRIGFEQFPFQEPRFYGAARPRLLFGCPSPRAASRLRLVDAGFWERTIGFSLETLYRAGMLFAVGAQVNEGYFNLRWYAQPNFADVSRLILAEHEARTLMREMFAATRDTLRGMCPVYERGYERVAFNPLVARPFVDLGNDQFLAPVPQFVSMRASAPALYYMALERIPDEHTRAGFTDDVGTLFEDYVLRQAEQLRIQKVSREIEYAKGAFTSDGILVFPDHVLLLEAKASRLTEISRRGGQTLLADLDRTIGRAIEQLERTASLIRDSHPHLAEIPSDRPIFGVVVTLEPYHFVNLARDALDLYPTSIPITIGHIGQFEQFVADALAEPPDTSTLAPLVSSNGSSWKIEQLLADRYPSDHRNPMLDAEYEDLSGFNLRGKRP